MTKHDERFDNITATGGIASTPEEIGGHRVIIYPIGPYEVFIKVSEDGKFIEVFKIRINKDFRSYHQRISSHGHIDVEEFYNE